MSVPILESPRKPSAPATLKDVALRAGVDKSRASVVLNGAKSSAGVSQSVRERILAAALELDYRPNAVGRALSRRKTGLIGFYSSYGHVNASDAFFADIIGGLQDGCEKLHQEIVMYSTGRNRTPDAIFRALTNGNIDGLVLFSPPDAPLVSQLKSAHLPVVAIADAIPDLPSVVVDDARGGELLARHLFERGHRRVLYRKRALNIVSSDRRFAAFQKTAQTLGMEIVETNGGVGELELTARETAILREANAPTAAVGWSDYAAFRLLEGAQKLGLRVPNELAIAGFNGLKFSFLQARQLTTIHAHWPEVARVAVALVAAQIEGETAPPETVLPVELLLGDTT